MAKTIVLENVGRSSDPPTTWKRALSGQLTPKQKRVRAWIRKHRGILKRIADAERVSEQFVGQLAYGRSNALPGHRVERVLREHGWPG